jgi:hypothetical protein
MPGPALTSGGILEKPRGAFRNKKPGLKGRGFLDQAGFSD